MLNNNFAEMFVNNKLIGMLLCVCYRYIHFMN